MKIEINEYYGTSLTLVAPENSTNGPAEIGILNITLDSQRGKIYVDWNNGDDGAHFDAYPSELSLDVTAKATVEYHETISLDVTFDTFDDYQSYMNDPEEFISANYEDDIVSSLIDNTPDDVDFDVLDINES